jgi:uncharacterized membrane protein (DUF2068 family)
VTEPPGLARARARPLSFLPRFHYELLVCGVRGHELLGLDAAELRPQDALFAFETDEEQPMRWLRCLRCDSWLALSRPTHPARRSPPERDEVELPLRGKALRDKLVLRLIAIDRAIHFVILALLAVAIFLFSADRAELHATFYRVLADLQGGLRGPAINSHGFVHSLDHLLSLQSGELHRLGYIIAAYAAIEGLEAVGLWFAKRWAEYLTFIATTALIPLEVHEIAVRVSVLKIATLLVNIAVVAYLIYAKRLFGIRGGARADEELRARDVGWEALERTAPAHVPATVGA